MWDITWDRRGNHVGLHNTKQLHINTMQVEGTCRNTLNSNPRAPYRVEEDFFLFFYSW